MQQRQSPGHQRDFKKITEDEGLQPQGQDWLIPAHHVAQPSQPQRVHHQQTERHGEHGARKRLIPATLRQSTHHGRSRHKAKQITTRGAYERRWPHAAHKHRQPSQTQRQIKYASTVYTAWRIPNTMASVANATTCIDMGTGQNGTDTLAPSVSAATPTHTVTSQAKVPWPATRHPADALGVWL